VKPLHLDLMTLAQAQRELGREDICKWIVKHVAIEQQAGRRRRGEARVKVRLARTGQWAWIRKGALEDD